MERDFITNLFLLRPELINVWKLELRSAPVVSALALPSSLEYLMTRTLDDLAIYLGLDTSTSTIDWPPPCGCGRNPFRAYYLTGETALRTVLTGQAPAAVARVHAAWRNIASVELGAFCGLCQFSGTAKLAGGCQRKTPIRKSVARSKSRSAKLKRSRQTVSK